MKLPVSSPGQTPPGVLVASGVGVGGTGVEVAVAVGVNVAVAVNVAVGVKVGGTVVEVAVAEPVGVCVGVGTVAVGVVGVAVAVGVTGVGVGVGSVPPGQRLTSGSCAARKVALTQSTRIGTEKPYMLTESGLLGAPLVMAAAWDPSMLKVTPLPYQSNRYVCQSVRPEAGRVRLRVVSE